MTPTRLLLADDHAVLRAGLRSLIEGQPTMAVVGEAADGRSAVRLAAELRPDVVVMDVNMPELNGVEATRQICHDSAHVRVVCLSGRSDERAIQEAFAAGARAYVCKDSAFEELATAVTAVRGGQTYLSPALAEVAGRPKADGTPVTISPAIAPGAGQAKLSGREREVLQLMSEGRATKEVAAALHVSVKTVETHRANLMNKLNIFSVAELTKYAIRQGIATVD